MSASVLDGISATGRLTARSYDVDVIHREYPMWDQMSDEERLSALDRNLAEKTSSTSNILLDNFTNFVGELIAEGLGDPERISHLALGDGTADPVPTVHQLNNEVYRTIIGTFEVDNGELLTSTLISQVEANGYTITEIGLSSSEVDGGELLSHATLNTGDEIVKDSGTVATIDYIIQFSRT